MVCKYVPAVNLHRQIEIYPLLDSFRQTDIIQKEQHGNSVHLAGEKCTCSCVVPSLFLSIIYYKLEKYIRYL